jgi:polygalacturonase
MSTLAAARADNFYFSKTYDPEKVKPRKSDLEERKPFTRVEGQHIYGKKIRYETPFHVRCNGCKNMIAKGVRFNAVQKWGTTIHLLSRQLLHNRDL